MTAEKRCENLGELLLQAGEVLREAGVENYENDAWLLWEFVSHMNHAAYLIKKNDALCEIDADGSMQEAYWQAVGKRSTRIPLQQITGIQNFYGLDFYVNRDVLVPRWDTENLVEQALKRIAEYDFAAGKNESCNDEERCRVLDMCTGSGCIAICIAKLSKAAVEVTAVDISEKALAVAKKNADTHQVSVCFLQSDLFSGVPKQKFDFIISNPPYIKSEVIPTLMAEVREHEPLIALDGEKDGLKFYREITEQAVMYLQSGGFLLYEIGHDQADDVSEIMKKYDFSDIRIVKDLSGLDRVVIGCKM